MDRAYELDCFLASKGWDNAERVSLGSDASKRSYHRLFKSKVGGKNTALLMDAPPGLGLNTEQFLIFGKVLRNFGFSAPEVYEYDVEKGFLIIEDLGHDLFRKVIEKDSGLAFSLYRSAIDALVQLRFLSDQIKCEKFEDVCSGWTFSFSTGSAIGDMKYSYDDYLKEAEIFSEWWIMRGGVKKGFSPELAKAEYLDIMKDICLKLAGFSECLSLRDCHAENLIWLPERSGIARIGLIDYQDALFGHSAYDLVSLLQDARSDVDPFIEIKMVDYFLDGLKKKGINEDRDFFKNMYALLGLQRNLKIVGIFVRLSARDGKHRYLDYIPRVWNYILNSCNNCDDPLGVTLIKFIKDKISVQV